jgi:S1-C subfamily serine protease
MNWSTESAPIYGKRLATAISGSLWSSMTGAPMPSMTVARYPWEAKPAAPRSSASAQQPQARERSDSAERNTPRPTSGTGFFVSKTGHIATNDHVVAACATPQIKIGTSIYRDGRILARDQVNDLALIKIDHQPTTFASIRLGARLGESVAVFGFPLMTLLASSGNFTLGNITATAGLADDQTQIQISAPVQPGNSGGPLLDQSGNVVGVVVSKLDVLRAASISGDFAQNVNFAIKANILAEFLAANNIRYQMGFRDDALDSADLAEQARDMSVAITCNSN